MGNNVLVIGVQNANGRGTIQAEIGRVRTQSVGLSRSCRPAHNWNRSPNIPAGIKTNVHPKTNVTRTTWFDDVYILLWKSNACRFILSFYIHSYHQIRCYQY